MMFFGSDARDDAERAIDDIRNLLDQQGYEFQRLIAELQLAVISMQTALETRKSAPAGR